MVGLLSGRLELDRSRAILPAGTDLIAGYVRGGHVTTTDPAAATVALPVANAMEIAKELERLGFVERGYLGLQVELTKLLRERGRVMAGVMVHRVVGASPAAEAGLIPGDVILEYAGARVQSPEDLSFLVVATVPGSNVPIRYLRRGVRAIAVAEIRQAPDSAWTPEMDASLAGRSPEAGVAPAVR